MRRIELNNWLCWILVFLAAGLSAQETPVSYYFEGDEVVFQFDSRLYEQATKQGSAEKLDFADLDIYKVAISGNFNNWSRKGWIMQKVSPYIYQLRKKIDAFNDDFTLEFKFIINGKYWAEPDDNFPNRVYADEFWEDVFNLSIHEIEPSDNGNITFRLKGYKRAREVVLTGSFNGWHEHYLKMKPSEEGWQLQLDLPPGKYEYKFLVDGKWIHDPANPDKVVNEYDTFNSVLEVTKEIHFSLNGFLDAKKVILAGSFNDWNEKSTKMRKTATGWELYLQLTGGKHFYKFIVDGEWMTDPQNPFEEKDRKGNINSVLIIQ